MKAPSNKINGTPWTFWHLYDLLPAAAWTGPLVRAWFEYNRSRRIMLWMPTLLVPTLRNVIQFSEAHGYASFPPCSLGGSGRRAHSMGVIAPMFRMIANTTDHRG